MMELILMKDDDFKEITCDLCDKVLGFVHYNYITWRYHITSITCVDCIPPEGDDNW